MAGLVNLTPIEAMRQDRKKLLAKYDDAIRESDEVAATCRALRAELQKVETLWSQACRERNEAVQLIRAMVNNAERGECQTLWSEKYTRENRLDSRVANHDSAAAFLSRLDAVRS